MHQYMQAIGFDVNAGRDVWQKLWEQAVQSPSGEDAFRRKNGSLFVRYYKEVAPGMGFAMCGEEEDGGIFHLEHCYPYYSGDSTPLKEEVVVNRRVDADVYTGMCEDDRVGVSLIFFLQNDMAYRQNRDLLQDTSVQASVVLSALSLSGKILLGVKTADERVVSRVPDLSHRYELIAEAKKGNTDAMESLAEEESDLYELVCDRSLHEDLYSIVDTTFIPFGSESDNYTIVANILSCKKVKNNITGVSIYVMHLECDDMELSLAIREADLYGEPEPGRRFKGTIWLQGQVLFENAIHYGT